VSLRRYNCRNVRDLLPLHVGGDLPPGRGAAVDEHLHRCLPCFREYRELTTMRERLGVLTDQPLPEGVLDGFTEEVMARIAVGEAGPRAPLPAALDRSRTWTRYAAAAAILLSFTLGLALLSSSDAPPLPGATDAAAAPSAAPLAGGDGSAPAPMVAGLDTFDAFPPQADEAGERVVTPAPMFDMQPLSRFEVRPVTGGSFRGLPEAQRTLIESAGPQALHALPCSGGLRPEPGRELRLREPR
jgi:hypothetical protein